MSYDNKDLEDLYKMFGQMDKLRVYINSTPEYAEHPTAKAMSNLLDEVIKLRADIEKLKAR